MVNTLDQFAFSLEKAINFTNFRENNDVLVLINEQKLTEKKGKFEMSEKMIKIRQ